MEMAKENLSVGTVLRGNPKTYLESTHFLFCLAPIKANYPLVLY